MARTSAINTLHVFPSYYMKCLGKIIDGVPRNIRFLVGIFQLLFLQKVSNKTCPSVGHDKFKSWTPFLSYVLESGLRTRLVSQVSSMNYPLLPICLVMKRI